MLHWQPTTSGKRCKHAGREMQRSCAIALVLPGLATTLLQGTTTVWCRTPGASSMTRQVHGGLLQLLLAYMHKTRLECFRYELNASDLHVLHLSSTASQLILLKFQCRLPVAAKCNTCKSDVSHISFALPIVHSSVMCSWFPLSYGHFGVPALQDSMAWSPCHIVSVDRNGYLICRML